MTDTSLRRAMLDYLYLQRFEFGSNVIRNNELAEHSKFYVKFLQPPSTSKVFGQCASVGKSNRPCNNSRQYGEIHCYRHHRVEDKVSRYKDNKELFHSLYVEGCGDDVCGDDVAILDNIVAFIDNIAQHQKYTLWTKINKYSKRNRLNLSMDEEHDVSIHSLESHFDLVVEKNKVNYYVNKNKCRAATKIGKQCENDVYYKTKYCAVHKNSKHVIDIKLYWEAEAVKIKSVEDTKVVEDTKDADGHKLTTINGKFDNKLKYVTFSFKGAELRLRGGNVLEKC